MPTPNLMAIGNLPVCSFCRPDVTANKKVAVCSTNELPWFVSSEAGRNPPTPYNADPNYAAIAGELPKLYGQGELALLKIGTGGCTAGDRLKSDNAGSGVKGAASGATLQNYGAIALATCAAGEFAPVYVHTMSEVCPT